MKINNKSLLLVAVLIVSVVFGGFIFASQTSKQNFQEKQLEKIIEAVEKQLEINREQTQREYKTKRVMDCYNLYLSEKNEWNNVESHRYISASDKCIVVYEGNEGSFEVSF